MFIVIKNKKNGINTLKIYYFQCLDEDDAPGVHAGVDSTNMHAPEHEHGVGWCAKIIFFLLMAILGGLVCLIMLENRGGSDCEYY